MREKPIGIGLVNLSHRITPACAGKTGTLTINSVRVKDHPRVCGKNRRNILRRASNGGSPPRVREKPDKERTQEIQNRITPACAGKTLFKYVKPSSTWDHPRVCGKNYLVSSKTQEIPGSPPRVREKLLASDGQGGYRRITPACAGKTASIKPLIPADQDHPRVCGKNKLLTAIQLRCIGSPPRVREKLNIKSWLSLPFGITPACAGKTSPCVINPM